MTIIQTQLQIEAESVAEILRATRVVAGLTTREIAPLVNASHGTVSNWERGKSEPSVTQFLLWAKATKQPAQLLLDGLSDVVRPEGLEPPTFCFGDSLDDELAFWSIVEPVAVAR